MRSTKIGIVGCGNISDLYFQAGQVFDILEIAACSDLIMDRAKQKAEQHGCKALTVEQLLADPDVEIVLNITTPPAHAAVAFKVLEAGKHVYNEKPVAVTREDGKRLLEMAKAKGLRIGCAPDTFMGAGIQTCVKLINDGWIGEPIGASAFMLQHGPEWWHPDPEFMYKPGGGPMFDIGPYYLTALIATIGPIRRVTGATRITFPERTITSQPKFGTKIKVEIPTHVAGVMIFDSGAIGAIVTSLDVWATALPRIEIYGTEGSLSVPDPNTFGGPVRVRRAEASEWAEIPLTHGYAEQSRGLGIADLAYSLRSGRQHRANAEMAYHVLDVIHAFHDASDQEKHVKLQSTCARPTPLPMGLRHGLVDE